MTVTTRGAGGEEQEQEEERDDVNAPSVVATGEDDDDDDDAKEDEGRARREDDEMRVKKKKKKKKKTKKTKTTKKNDEKDIAGEKTTTKENAESVEPSPPPPAPPPPSLSSGRDAPKHHLWLGRRMKIERGTGAASTSYKRPTIACIVFHDPSESHPFHVTFEDGTNAWVRIECKSLPTLNMNGQNTANASVTAADGEIFIRNEDYKANTRLGSHGKGNGKESGEKSFEWLGDKSTLGIATNINGGVNKGHNNQQQQYQQQFRLQQHQQQPEEDAEEMRGTNTNSLGRQQQQRKRKRGMQQYGNNNKHRNGNGQQGGYFNDGGIYGNDNAYIGFGGMRVNDNWNTNNSNNTNNYNFQLQQYQQQMQHLQMQQHQLQMRYNNVTNDNSKGKKKKKNAKKGTNTMNDLYGSSNMMNLPPLQIPPNATHQQRYSMLQQQMQQHVFQQQQQMQRQQMQRQRQQHQHQQRQYHQQQNTQQRKSHHKNTGAGGTSSPRAKNNNAGAQPTRGSTRLKNDAMETFPPPQPTRPLAATLFEQHEIARCTVCDKVCKSHPGFVAHVKKHAEEYPAKVRAMLAASKKYRSKQPHRSAEYLQKMNAANNNNNNITSTKAATTTTARATRSGREQSLHPQENGFGTSGYDTYASGKDVPTVTTGRTRRQGAGQRIESDYVYVGNMEKMRKAREGNRVREMPREYDPNGIDTIKKRKKKLVNVPRTCEYCGRVCASAVGHASHVRSCKKIRRS